MVDAVVAAPEARGGVSRLTSATRLCSQELRQTECLQTLVTTTNYMYMSVHYIVIIIRCNILYEENKLDYIQGGPKKR